MTFSKNRADIGDLVRSECVFKATSTGAVADPTGVSLTVTLPSLSTVTVTYGGAGSGQVGAIAKDGTGVYHADVTINAAGDWKFKWLGTGAVVAGSPVELVTVRD